MQAIILAAGMGKRLKELTRNNTKCMVKVNGVTLIDRMLHQIEKQHLSRIIIVVGYEGRKLIDYVNTLDIRTPVIFINNPIYDKTNNIYSLALAKDWLVKEDTLLFESDLIFEDSALDALVSDPHRACDDDRHECGEGDRHPVPCFAGLPDDHCVQARSAAFCDRFGLGLHLRSLRVRLHPGYAPRAAHGCGHDGTIGRQLLSACPLLSGRFDADGFRVLFVQEEADRKEAEEPGGA